MKRKNKNIYEISRSSNIILNIFFFCAMLACIMPVFLVLAVSLTEHTSLLKNGYRFIPETWSTEAYEYLLGDFTLVSRAYGVTIFVCVVGAVLSVLFQALYAYPLSRKDFPYKAFFTTFILITMLFSGGLGPWYYIYVRVLGLRNSIWALILPGLGGGFGIFVMRTFFKQNIPSEVIESAKIDGAQEATIFLKIVLPLSLPVLATFGLLSVIGYWNDFFNCLLFIDKPALYNIQFVMQRALLNLQFIQNNIKHLAAAGVDVSQVGANQIPSETIRMAMVMAGVGPIVLAYPFFQRYFVKGLTIGAVKG